MERHTSIHPRIRDRPRRHTYIHRCHFIHTTTTDATPPPYTATRTLAGGTNNDRPRRHTPPVPLYLSLHYRAEKQGRPTDREKSGRITKVLLKYGGQTSIHPRIEPTKSGTRKVAKPSKVILKYGGQTSIHPRIATAKSGPRQHHHTPPVPLH